MIDPAMKLRADVLEGTEVAATREGFGRGLVEAADRDERIVGLCADLTESTKMDAFAKKYPARFVEIGVAEQNLATIAAGMDAYGKLPCITSYAAFSPGRNWEQIRTTIALNNVPVVIAGSHAGVSVGPDGATHQMLEDVALMRAMPNMTVVSPCDAEEARKATIAAARLGSPVYIRLAREKTPLITTSETPFEVGKANVLWIPSGPTDAERCDCALFVTGTLAHNALLAARELESEGVRTRVINIHTVKPLDTATVVAAAREAGAVVTVEEHQVHGGLGGAIAECLAREYPVPQEFVAVRDTFGQSGTPKELIEHYGLGVPHIVAATRRVVSRKSS